MAYPRYTDTAIRLSPTVFLTIAPGVALPFLAVVVITGYRFSVTFC